MTEQASVQWFPGHMAKTRRMIKDNLKLVDIVVELRDARIPQSSSNPELHNWIGNKKRLVVLNKCDTADHRITSRWLDYYKSEGVLAIATDSKTGKGLDKFLPTVQDALSEVLARRAEKGMAGKALRMMVVGIPNVGKSSFINKLAKEKRAKVEDRPGVTRGKQWVTVSRDVELLDMPGVLWPKFEDPSVGEKLAFTGAVKDQVLDVELLAMRLLEFMRSEYKNALLERFKITEDDMCDLEPYDLLCLVGKKRGMLISGGEIDTLRAATMVLDEYRGGKFGKMSLEVPEN